MTKHAPANRLTRFSRPAGSTVDYVQLERERADRMEARAVKLLAERAQLVAALRTLQGRIDACELGPVNVIGCDRADLIAEECAVSRALLRSLGEVQS